MKTLVLIRHAHRDTSRRELDNGLSDKGKEQSKAIRRFFLERFKSDELDKGLWLVSSPKRRCVETLSPLAKAFERQVDVHPDLDEASGRENEKRLVERVEHFLHEWQQSAASLTVLCSHGDWLPLASYHLLGIPLDFKKGAWLELNWESGRAVQQWYVPTFKYFYR